MGTEAESATFRRPSGGLSRTSPGFIDADDSFAPTTIILDTIMPGVDGNELVLWLAKRIIVTGYTPDYAAHAKVLAE